MRNPLLGRAPENLAMNPTPLGSNPRIEDYLDRLTAPLVGVVPSEDRLRLRTEAAAHLERQAERAVLSGGDEIEATERAIEAYGPAAVVAREYLETWFENGVNGPLYARFGRANLVAFTRFAIAHTLFGLLLQVRVFLPSEAAYSLPISPAEARRFLPAPLPVPEDPAFGLLSTAYLLFAPLVAGWLTGLAIPVNASRSAAHAMLPIVAFSFCAGSLVLPMTEGIAFAFIQVVYWLPAGMFAAHLGRAHARLRALEGR